MKTIDIIDVLSQTWVIGPRDADSIQREHHQRHGVVVRVSILEHLLHNPAAAQRSKRKEGQEGYCGAFCLFSFHLAALNHQ